MNENEANEYERGARAAQKIIMGLKEEGFSSLEMLGCLESIKFVILRELAEGKR